MRLAVTLKFAFYILAVFMLFTLLGTPVGTLDIVLTLVVLVIISLVFYHNVLEDLIYKAELYKAAEPDYIESLARYRGTLNSSHGIPEGWIIEYDNSLDQHEYVETGERGDDDLSFIVHFRESGYLQIEGTAQKPTIDYYPKKRNEPESDKIKIKITRNGNVIYNRGYPK